MAARLGVLDEASGLLAVARRRNAGTLDRDAFVGACRRAAANLDVLTGLPRADRRIEVRPEAMTGILEVAAELGDVVVDTGFSVEDAATILEVPPGTVKSRCFRARARLAVSLGHLRNPDAPQSVPPQADPEGGTS